jgi:DNA-binding NarL/FixJ family response regulator
MTDKIFDVVIIDDESTVTDLFQQFILWKYKDWDFLTFNNSDILHTAITNRTVNARVWVIDMMMPGKNGADLAVTIRDIYGDKPVLLAYTALDKRTLETQKAYAHGIKHFKHVVNKREDFTSILSLIEIWIAQSA